MPQQYLDADLYNRLQMHLLNEGSRNSLLLAGELQVATGASVLRKRSQKTVEQIVEETASKTTGGLAVPLTNAVKEWMTHAVNAYIAEQEQS